MTLEYKFHKWIHMNYLTNGILYLDKNDTISFTNIVNEFIKTYHLDEQKSKELLDYCNTHYQIRML